MLPYLTLAWLSLAIAAAGEAWTPGSHANIPLDGTEGGYVTIDIPGGYDQEQPPLPHPVLFLHDPGGKPPNHLFRGWAGANGAIIVGVGGAKNGPTPPIQRIQAAALAYAERELRLSQALRFSAGMSGAAQMSWVFAVDHPKTHAGILMLGQAGHSQLPPKWVAVGYVHGDQEPNKDSILANEGRLRGNGNPVRRVQVSGGHVMGSGKEHNPLLDWMLRLAYGSQPNLSDGDRALGSSLLTRLHQAASAQTEPDKKLHALDSVLTHPLAAKFDGLEALRREWLAAQTARWDAASDDRIRLDLVFEAVTGEAISRLDAAQAKTVRERWSALAKDRTLSSEAKLLEQFAALRQTWQNPKNLSEQARAEKSLQALIAQAGDSLAAIRARSLLGIAAAAGGKP